MNETEITDKINALTEQDWTELQDLYERVLAHEGGFQKWVVVRNYLTGQ